MTNVTALLNDVIINLRPSINSGRDSCTVCVYVYKHPYNIIPMWCTYAIPGHVPSKENAQTMTADHLSLSIHDFRTNVSPVHISRSESTHAYTRTRTHLYTHARARARHCCVSNRPHAPRPLLYAFADVCSPALSRFLRPNSPLPPPCRRIMNNN